MDENKIFIVPTDPRHVPDSQRVEQAIDYLQAEGFAKDDLELIDDGRIQCYLNGPYNVEVFCPHCQAQLSMDWWLEQMGQDESNQGHSLENFALPCCAATGSLERLVYQEMDVAFARFAIEICDDEGIDISPEQERRLNELLGCPVRVVYWAM